jgi:hypothetical protein
LVARTSEDLVSWDLLSPSWDLSSEEAGDELTELITLRRTLGSEEDGTFLRLEVETVP